jgi:ankyrin repeat protein
MTPFSRRGQSGSTAAATLFGLVLLGVAAQAASIALGWSKLQLPLATWVLWAIAGACAAGAVAMLRGTDGGSPGNLTPDELAARGDFTDPGRMAGLAPQKTPTVPKPAATAKARTLRGKADPSRDNAPPWRLRTAAVLIIAAFLWTNGALHEAWRAAVDVVSGSADNAPPPAARAPDPAPPAVQRPAPRPAPPASAMTAPAAPVVCGEALLHQAAAAPCLKRLEQLLETRPGEIESRDARGLTPLAAAVLADRIEAAEMLLKARADVNAKVRFAPGTAANVGGLAKAQTPQLAEFSTPLILARSAPMATLLLRYSADPLLKNDYGWSAIFYYTRNGNPAMIDILIAGGANIDDTANVDPSHAGSTPLMWAAYMNLLPQLDALLKHQPRLDIRDRAGNTALDYATRFKHSEAVARLKAAVVATAK